MAGLALAGHHPRKQHLEGPYMLTWRPSRPRAPAGRWAADSRSLPGRSHGGRPPPTAGPAPTAGICPAPHPGSWENAGAAPPARWAWTGHLGTALCHVGGRHVASSWAAQDGPVPPHPTPQGTRQPRPGGPGSPAGRGRRDLPRGSGQEGVIIVPVHKEGLDTDPSLFVKIDSKWGSKYKTTM